MKSSSPLAYSVNAPICQHHRLVHFLSSPFVGGIAEYMSEDFLKRFHSSVYNAGKPPGNLSSVDWRSVRYIELHCLPLSLILHHAGKYHINFFVLDVEVSYYTDLHIH